MDDDGVTDIAHLELLLEESKNPKKLISVMMANNETGAIQPIKEVTILAKKFNALVHSDCVQAIGKMQVNIAELDIDFVTISGHKFGAIAGAAALIIKNKHLLKPMIIGGKQESGVRSGTENDPRFVRLQEALHSPAVVKKAQELFGPGGAIPAWGTAPTASPASK